MKIYGLIILILSFISCQSGLDKLFWINENTKHKSDFLFMAESTNILPISADSVRLFLNWNEIKETRYLESNIFTNDTVLPEPVIFKAFGEIYKTDYFKLHVIFRDGNDTIGRDYKFMLRTYSHDWEIIDSYDLAIWNKRADKYCFGSINDNLIIEKRCKSSDFSEIMQITENGKIIATSFHKP
jgi:hypothetical protein